MTDRLNSQGFIKMVFGLVLLVAVAFVLLSFGRPYYRYYTLRSYAHDELLIEVGNLTTIRQKVLERAAELGIPLDKNNLEVTENLKIVTVKARWSEVVDFWGYYSKRLNFKINEAY